MIKMRCLLTRESKNYIFRKMSTIITMDDMLKIKCAWLMMNEEK